MPIRVTACVLLLPIHTFCFRDSPVSIERWSESIWVAALANEPALSDDLLQLIDQLEHGPEGARSDVVLNFKAVTAVNSSNLSQMLRLRKVASDHDLKLRIVSVPDGVWAVLLTTGLDQLFKFMPDVPTALASLQMGQ